MANNKKPRGKTGNAKKVAPKKASKSAPKKKPSKPVKKSKPLAGQQVGAPPTDMTPPQIDDTRPVHKPIHTHAKEPVHSASPEPVVTSDLRGVTAEDTEASRRAVTTGEVGGTAGTGHLMQGATCTWIGRESQAAKDMATGALLCPHCNGRLVQLAGDEKTLELGFEAWELGAYPSADHNHPPRPHPGYRGLVTWMRKQSMCWMTIEQAASDYRKATGNNVDPSL